MTTTNYRVGGLTCAHCVSAVTQELSSLEGVSAVEIELVAGGTSTVAVTATPPLTHEQVAAALDETGDYALADGVD